jgi:hypothetical protein
MIHQRQHWNVMVSLSKVIGIYTVRIQFTLCLTMHRLNSADLPMILPADSSRYLNSWSNLYLAEVKSRLGCPLRESSITSLPSEMTVRSTGPLTAECKRCAGPFRSEAHVSRESGQLASGGEIADPCPRYTHCNNHRSVGGLSLAGC